jgi:hypothetical protein
VLGWQVGSPGKYRCWFKKKLHASSHFIFYYSRLMWSMRKHFQETLCIGVTFSSFSQGKQIWEKPGLFAETTSLSFANDKFVSPLN